MKGKSTVEPGRPQRTIWRVRIACWLQKVTNTHSEHVILIAFPPQQWLHEHTFMFRYPHIACFVPDYETKMHIASLPVCLTTHVLWLSQLCQNNF